MTPISPYTARRWQSLHEFIYKWIKILGIASLGTTSSLFFWIFFTAYNSKTKTTIVDINAYGEATLEMILLLVLLIPTLYILARATFREAQSETD